MDRQQMEHCQGLVAAYRASGQRSQQWALANGVKPHELASWCAHAGRWQAKLDGVVLAPVACKPPVAFVAARVPPSTSASVRIELQTGTSRLELHWPLAHTVELAALLREVGR